METFRRRVLLLFFVLFLFSSCILVYQPQIWDETIYYSHTAAVGQSLLRTFRLKAKQQAITTTTVELESDQQWMSKQGKVLTEERNNSIPAVPHVTQYFHRQEETEQRGSYKAGWQVKKTESECESKVTRFVLIKTEKTGSSTLFSLLGRFIIRNQLNVMVMTKGGHLDVTKPRGAKPGWDIGPRKDEMADCLIHHSRYNKTLLEVYIKPGAKYITLVRDAKSWFTSAVKFWPNQLGSKSPEVILDGTADGDRVLYTKRSVLRDEYNGQKTLLHLSQLQWLGFDYSQHNDIEAVKTYIQQITDRMDIGFLTDQFDACLVLLRREFCWDHGDIFYTAKEVGGRKPEVKYPPLSQKATQYLLSARVNLGEQLLYQAFNNSWWSRPEVSDPDFIEEVKQFKESNSLAQQKCQKIYITHGGEDRVAANRWSAEIHLTASYCRLLLQENYSLLSGVAAYAIRSSYDPKS